MLFENYSNHVGWHFPYLNTPYKLKLFVNILRGKLQREKSRNVVGGFNTKSENENQNWKKQFNFHSEVKTRARRPYSFISGKQAEFR